MGAAGGNRTHRDCSERRARHADWSAQRIPRRPGARSISSVRRLGAVCGSARPADRGSSVMPSRPALILSALFLIQGAGFYGLSRRVEVIRPSRPLAEFPAVIGDWHKVREGVIEQDERDVLRADDYLTRQYVATSGETASLFVAYFQS